MNSHRISGKTPIEDVIETMKEFVEYALLPTSSSLTRCLKC